MFLMIAGLAVSLAASPPIAAKSGLEPFHFFKLHLLWAALGAVIMIGTSLLSMKLLRRLSLILFLSSLLLMVAALGLGDAVNGARRWVQISGWSLQPSEIAKPAFVVLVAWFFSQGIERPEMPGNILSLATYVVFAALLVLQPDIGQAVLVTAVWGGLLFLSGAPLLRVGLLGAIGAAGVTIAYFTLPHVRVRLDRFFDSSSGDTYQTDKALESFVEGGWLGRGPGEGVVKHLLPDSHTDFPFAVIGEEFGILACLLVLGLYACIIARVLALAATGKNRFACYASTGLITLVGLQAAINMSVNTGLLPAKGMTLPFLSYGGSSLLGLSLTMGMVLALTRRPYLQSDSDPLSANPHKFGVMTSR